MLHAAAKQTSFAMDEHENIFASGFAEVDKHVSFLTAFEDEDMGAEHSFLGPECSRDIASTHLGLGTFDLPKCFSIDNISCAFDDDEMTVDNVAATVVAGEQTKTELFGEALEPKGEKILHEDKCCQPAAGQHFMDSEYMDDASNIICFPSEDSHLQGTLALQSELMLLDGRACSTAAATESTSCQNSVSLDHMTVRELQDAFHSMFGRETAVIDKQWLKRRILFGLHNNNELDRPLNLTCCGSISQEKEDKSTVASGTESSENAFNSPKWMLDGGFKMDEKMKGSSSDSQTNYSSGASESDVSFHGKDENEVGGLVTGKRVHKPPRRYIEESSEFKSRSHPRRSSVSVKSPKNKVVDAKIHKQCEEEVNETAGSGNQIGSFDGACIQVPFGLPVEEEQAKGNTLCLRQDSDICPKTEHAAIPSEISDLPCPSAKSQTIVKDERVIRSNMQKGRRRRKHHMPWTLTEVMKLIEGVSHLGVGRWSKIKRLLFSSSKHRTSVDLKDKWRNLVKASCTQLRKKRKGLQVRKQLSHQAPESVLCRVKELASSCA
ncbi:uncharacterized protein LOC104421640 isoform X1 [Eucalyptus grandis]|uniref:Uncharacterized protein n=2 Tax=Eucalyptus grandis TaxID=71139 RepID=A0ACC3J5H3_EUCGR|nr:uncharacterized protein LOC104421640 isoform X1 [Eucalyptus grandis]KAK3408730.1 hypothetical protein EUGRSUZ_J00905 [Eucalyptus grandis]